jgi:glycine/D-amino acid oxidase-like deaminating enzyme
MPKSLATEGRDLRTGLPLWLAGGRTHVRCRRGLGRQRFDTVIVGAGISGAILAYTLRRKGKSVLVLDRRAPLHGSTAASTALLQFEIDTPLFALSRRIGHGNAVRAWKRSLQAVGDLRRIVAREKIACGWREAKTLYLAGNAYGSRALAMETEARKAAAIPGTFLHAAALRERFGIDRTGGILSDGSAHANPVKLAAGLLRRAAKAGVCLCAPTAIKAVAADASGVILTTDADVEIETRHAVFCTGYELLKSVPATGHSVKSTWALASEPGARAPAWLSDHLVWEASDPYLYMRMTGRRRVIVGGEDEPFSKAHADEALLRKKTDRIAALARALIPELRFRVEHSWAGAFGESDTGLPFIDAVPGHPNCFAVMGFGGNGITYSMIAAEIVAKLIRGEGDPDADLYRFPAA